MDIREAKRIYRELGYKSVLSEEEEFTLIEALEYLVKMTGDTRWMVELGGYYYGEKNYDLALKYYEMADKHGDKWAPEGLGYIWYYGRTGKKDYEKAFKYYSRAAENGYIKSKIKVADMYKNGYYVEKDFNMYMKLLEEVYQVIKDTDNCFDPLPEVCTRLARGAKEAGIYDEAIRLYLEAKPVLARRIQYNPFFGDLNIMKWLVADLYGELMPVDYADLDLFDLYYVLKKPAVVKFMFDDETYTVASVEEDGGIVIKFEDKWYRNIDDFFGKAVIDGEKLVVLYDEIYNIEVVSGGNH